jgi:hypothetical protein
VSIIIPLSSHLTGWCLVWTEGLTSQGYVVSIRVTFTLETSLLCLLVAAAGSKELCGLGSIKLLTPKASPLSPVCTPGLTNVRAEDCL